MAKHMYTVQEVAAIIGNYDTDNTDSDDEEAGNTSDNGVSDPRSESDVVESESEAVENESEDPSVKFTPRDGTITGALLHSTME